MEKRTNIKNDITKKNAKVLKRTGWMLIEIKRYAKFEKV
jgi:hypothetical protein